MLALHLIYFCFTSNKNLSKFINFVVAFMLVHCSFCLSARFGLTNGLDDPVTY